MAKRQLPVSSDVFAYEMASAVADGRGVAREDAMGAAITAAMRMLTDAPPGEIALLSACRGAPLCTARDTASCPMCECVAVSEDGIVGYPGSGRA